MYLTVVMKINVLCVFLKGFGAHLQNNKRNCACNSINSKISPTVEKKTKQNKTKQTKKKWPNSTNTKKENPFTLTACLFVSVFVFLSQSEKLQCAVIT